MDTHMQIEPATFRGSQRRQDIHFDAPMMRALREIQRRAWGLPCGYWADLWVHQPDDLEGAVCIDIRPLGELAGLPDFGLYFRRSGIEAVMCLEPDEGDNEERFGPFAEIAEVFECIHGELEAVLARSGLVPVERNFESAERLRNLIARGIRVDLSRPELSEAAAKAA